jgi:hypothetical protein
VGATEVLTADTLAEEPPSRQRPSQGPAMMNLGGIDHVDISSESRHDDCLVKEKEVVSEDSRGDIPQERGG